MALAYTSIAQNADICFAISTSDLGLTPLDAGYGPAIFDPDADREIISVDIERDFDILAVQVRSRRIVKPRYFATRHNQAAHRLAIAAPALEPIAEMDRADLVLVGAVDPIISHGNQGDLIWQCGKHGPNGRIRGGERGCVEPLGAVCRDDDPLGPGARPLDNRLTLEIELGDLERRIPEVEPQVAPGPIPRPYRPVRYQRRATPAPLPP